MGELQVLVDQVARPRAVPGRARGMQASPDDSRLQDGIGRHPRCRTGNRAESLGFVDRSEVTAANPRGGYSGSCPDSWLAFPE